MNNSDQTAASAEREFIFEPYRFIPAQQLLLYHDAPVRLGSRALDILAELVERPGEVVSKHDLMARAWPKSVVEENNLKVHISALRRAMCDGGRENRYVATVTGRGYRFVAPVTSQVRETPLEPLPATWEQLRKLPAPASRTTGRTETIAALLRILEQRRFVSIVGPGGIGKSTVALPVAEAFIAHTDIEICFVELSPLSDEKFVVGAVAAALGLTVHSGDGIQSLVATLRERRLLLVLDSCEHVIDAVAVLVEQIINRAPEVRILATSREPLRAASEYVYRLTPLAYPAAGGPITAAQALTFPAVLLFCLRAAESLDGYELTDADTPAVVEICRRLEGIPLAIELAATRMDALGAAELAARLGGRFELLKRGRRGVLERHRTLSASLDWSYDLLQDSERALLRKLSVFSGKFDLDAATALCGEELADTALVVDGVANLVDKSMLVADLRASSVHYRLLDTTKAYALEKLDESGETGRFRRRHLEFHRDRLVQSAQEQDSLSDADWIARYGRYLDDVRSALGWAFAAEDSSALAISLTVAAIPLWTQLSLLEECYQFVERALACGVASRSDELKLRAALGAAVLYVNGPVPSTEAAWTAVLDLADALDDKECQLIALWGMAVCRAYAGEVPGVLQLAARFQDIAVTVDRHTVPSSMDRLIATARHYSGEQAVARTLLQEILDHYVAPAHKSRLVRMQLNQRSASLGTLANVLWLQGYPQQAVETVEAAMEAARSSGHAPSVMYAIANAAFPIMIHVGDHAAAERLLAELADYLKQHAFTLWDTLWNCLQATVQVQRGDTSALFALERAVAQLQDAGYRPRMACHLAKLAMTLNVQGRQDTGLTLIEYALALCDMGQERWCQAEMLRIKGVLLEAGDQQLAEALYRQAIEVAGAQGALSWQLRAANSLASLKLRQGCGEEGQRLLRGIYGRFEEGFDTADLIEARSLLDQAG
ncbi:ATP-binding protein [Duganella aquatilis]|nr:winged helix-turn-helix domain-containing protein [Duganella aquatilis]